MALTVLLGGIAASFVLRGALQRREDFATAAHVAGQTVLLRDLVQRECDLFIEVLASLGELHALSENVSAEAFEELSRKGLSFQQAILGGYGFVQRLPREMRRIFEESSVADQRILLTEFDQNGLRPAGDRDDYYPLTYDAPRGSMGVPVGFDLASVPAISEAIAVMKETGRPAYGGAVAMAQDTERIGYYILAPIQYGRAEAAPQPASPYLYGFTASILWPQSLLQRALPTPMGKDVTLRLIPAEATNDLVPAPAFSHRENLRVANQDWIFECTARAGFVAAHRSQKPAVALAAGLGATTLASFFLFTASARARRIELLVQKRTAELRVANERLAEEMSERKKLEAEIIEISHREQQRVGQDLHDSLGQKLTGALFLSRALMDSGAAGDVESRQQAERVNQILKESVAQVRRIARGLSPVEVDEEGLPNALRRLAEDCRVTFDMDCEVDASSFAGALPVAAATHLYLIAQEAVHNAVKHGEARKIDIRLASDASSLLLQVADHGKGMPTAAAPAGGMGLRIMKYRAELIGGHVEISATPGGGATVTCRAPVVAASRKNGYG